MRAADENGPGKLNPKVVLKGTGRGTWEPELATVIPLFCTAHKIAPAIWREATKAGFAVEKLLRAIMTTLLD